MALLTVDYTRTLRSPAGVSDPIVEVALNGVDWTTWCRHFRYAKWELATIEPANALPGMPIKLKGAGLGEGGVDADILVRFEALSPEGAAGLVRASSPSNARACGLHGTGGARARAGRL